MSNDDNLSSNLKEMADLDERIKAIEQKVQQRKAESLQSEKNLKSCERRINELEFQADEDKFNYDKMEDIVHNLESSAMSYKRLVEDAEEIAALNMAKYAETQRDIDAAKERFQKSGVVNIIRKKEN